MNSADFPLAQAFTPGSRVPTDQIARFTGLGLAFRQLSASEFDIHKLKLREKPRERG